MKNNIDFIKWAEALANTAKQAQEMGYTVEEVVKIVNIFNSCENES